VPGRIPCVLVGLRFESDKYDRQINKQCNFLLLLDYLLYSNNGSFLFSLPKQTLRRQDSLQRVITIPIWNWRGVEPHFPRDRCAFMSRPRFYNFLCTYRKRHADRIFFVNPVVRWSSRSCRLPDGHLDVVAVVVSLMLARIALGSCAPRRLPRAMYLPEILESGRFMNGLPVFGRTTLSLAIVHQGYSRTGRVHQLRRPE